MTQLYQHFYISHILPWPHETTPLSSHGYEKNWIGTLSPTWFRDISLRTILSFCASINHHCQLPWDVVEWQKLAKQKGSSTPTVAFSNQNCSQSPTTCALLGNYGTRSQLCFLDSTFICLLRFLPISADQQRFFFLVGNVPLHLHLTQKGD